MGGAIAKTNERFLDSMYAAHPQLPPHRRASKADVLRESAQQIEWAETQHLVDSVVRERSIHLLECRDIVSRRARL